MKKASPAFLKESLAKNFMRAMRRRQSAEAAVSFRPPFSKGGGVLGQRPEPLSAESGIFARKFWTGVNDAQWQRGGLFEKRLPLIYGSFYVKTVFYLKIR